MTIQLRGAGPIVLVDDSDTDRMIARECYKRSKLNRDLLEFSGAEEYLKHLDAVEDGRAPMPSIVMLDINMPGVDGFQALESTRQREPFADLPVCVMLTNSDDPKDVKKAMALGADGFQTKPMKASDYVAFFDSLVPATRTAPGT